MFNTLLQQQQAHQSSPPIHTLSSNSHLWNSGTLSPATDPSYGCKNLLLDADTTKKFRRPHQYAYPLRTSSDVANRIQLSTPASRISASEHMLRRKTPTGTLAAGYDGTSVEWTKRPHATKHILMPASGAGDRTVTDLMSTPLKTYSSINTIVIPAEVDNPRNGTWVTDTLLDKGTKGDYWANNISESRGLDPLLDSTTLPQQYCQSAGFQQVPTILQPAWPPCLGPTASNEQAPYGPYWPNGSFIPYRPAAVRDVRFSPQLNVRAKAGTTQANQGRHENSYDQLSEQFANRFHTSRLDHGTILNRAHGNLPDEALVPPKEIYSSKNQIKVAPSHITYEAEQVQRTALTYRGKTHSLSGTGFHRSDSSWPPASISFMSNTSQQDQPIINSIQSKERVLTWAHQIYVNLLAALHQSRKHTHSNQHSADRQTSQACIYPKLPIQFASQDMIGISQNNQDCRDGYDSRKDNSPLRRSFADFAIQGLNDLSDSVHNSTQSQLEVPRSRYESVLKEPWQSGPWQNPASPASSTGTRGVERFGRPPSRTSPPLVSGLHAYSPSADATAALEILTQLCHESYWQWTDGLLLGGCLAYGLADFDKALQWYSRVLACDPK